MKFAHPLYLTIAASVLFTSNQNEILSNAIHHEYNQIISVELDRWRLQMTIKMTQCKTAVTPVR